MANTVVTVVWLALAGAQYEALRLESGDSFAEMNRMGLGYPANIGGIITPVGTPTNVVVIGYRGSRTWLVFKLSEYGTVLVQL